MRSEREIDWLIKQAVKEAERPLRDAIEKLRVALEKARPYVAELASFSNSAFAHRDLLTEIDEACGIYRR